MKVTFNFVYNDHFALKSSTNKFGRQLSATLNTDLCFDCVFIVGSGLSLQI